jgi:hypothetical protein
MFRIRGSEGRPGATATADDTPATAHPLGTVTGSGLVQVTGVIGDDPTDPIPFNAADVDLFHFQISGPGRYAFIAEVFAGRIGSPLDPGLSLYRQHTDGRLLLVAGNDQTLNGTVARNRFVPLYTDATLYAGLTSGSYYLAVSSSGNVPDPLLDLAPGSDGIFDPHVSHSASAGSSVGEYVLNFLVYADQTPPRVTAATLQNGAVLDHPPTHLVVQFSEPVNLQQLAYQAYQQAAVDMVRPVVIRGMDGTAYYPRLVATDPVTNRATFLMLDGLQHGAYRLHLSGGLGLTDFAGNPLVHNHPSGDYVIHFTVTGSARGTPENPLLWLAQEPNDDLAQPQVLGVLFPHEFQAGVTVSRDPRQRPEGAPADTADHYQFEVLQEQNYLFLVTSSALPSGIQLTLFDSAGNQLDAAIQGDGSGLQAALQPGIYTLRVDGWTPHQAGDVNYHLVLSIGGASDNPPPLTAGPVPALRIRFVTDAPPPPRAVLPNLSSGSYTPVGIPPNLLVALGTGPVGGISSEGNEPRRSPADRVSIQRPDSQFVQRLMASTLLIQTPDLEADTAEELHETSRGVGIIDWQALAAEAVGVSQTLCGQAADAVFEMADWLEEVPVPFMESAATPAEDVSELQGTDGGEPETAAVAARSGDAQIPTYPLWIGAIVTAAAGAFTGIAARRRQLTPQRPEGWFSPVGGRPN